jgi:hypothetical protein
MSSETDRATAYDLIEVHGRCGGRDGECPCHDSTFNRWKSGFLDFGALKAEGWTDFDIAKRVAEYSGHPQYRQPARQGHGDGADSELQIRLSNQ